MIMMKHGNNKMAKMNYNWYRSTRVHVFIHFWGDTDTHQRIWGFEKRVLDMCNFRNAPYAVCKSQVFKPPAST